MRDGQPPTEVTGPVGSAGQLRRGGQKNGGRVLQPGACLLAYLVPLNQCIHGGANGGGGTTSQFGVAGFHGSIELIKRPVQRLRLAAV